MTSRKLIIPLIAAVAILSAGCGEDDNSTFVPASRQADRYDANVATEWFALSYGLVRDARLAPPVAARLYAYCGVALYESVVPGMPDHAGMGGKLNGFHGSPPPPEDREMNWPLVANAAMAEVLHGLLPQGSALHARVDSLSDLLRRQFGEGVSPLSYNASIEYGGDVAAAILDWSHTDGYAGQGSCGFTPPVGFGYWESTPPAFAPPLLPCWGEMRPFVLADVMECEPVSPPAYSEDSTSAFYAEAMEVYTTVNSLTAEQREIAMFWSDDPGQTGTPPGHSISILTQFIQANELTLDVAAEAYARVSMALNDAFISCWKYKYVMNLVRPVTYIRAIMDSSWMPILNTPPFPECPSGHSVASAAAAQVLTDMFGVVAFTDHTHDARGLSPRSFAGFNQFAEEAALSRLYGGIHFRTAIEGGLIQGRCIGEQVSALRLQQ